MFLAKPPSPPLNCKTIGKNESWHGSLCPVEWFLGHIIYVCLRGVSLNRRSLIQLEMIKIIQLFEWHKSMRICLFF